VIVLLPKEFRNPMARLAVENGVHFVDASYATEEYHELHGLAIKKDVAMLPEFGLDPGIDLVLAAQALDEFEEIHEFYSYGAGIPEEDSANNPLRYKISWTFEGVLNSYSRAARVWKSGSPRDIPAQHVFDEKNVHLVQVDGFGGLEAYPNGDVVKYLEILELTGTVRHAGRYSMRWPGHSAFWNIMVKMGFLEEKTIEVSKNLVSPKEFVHNLLAPQLQYQEGERDAVIVRVEVLGLKNDQKKRAIYQVVDYRDLETGFLAMQRTVGFTASIGAQMILRGDIKKRGLLSPLKDVPANIVLQELEKRNIQVERWEI